MGTCTGCCDVGCMRTSEGTSDFAAKQTSEEMYMDHDMIRRQLLGVSRRVR
jgi:hypothetical protein